MKILMITNNYTPYTGGVVSSINALVHELRSVGHQVLLVALDFKVAHNDPEWVVRLYCPVRFFYKNNPMALAWRPRRQVNEVVSNFNPDIIHVHHPFLLGTVARKVARLHKIPVIFTHHTLYEAYAHYVPLRPRQLVKHIIERLVISFCQKVDGVIAPGSYVSQRIAPHTAASVCVIPSGVLHTFITSAVQKEITLGPIKLLVVSRLVKEKNISFLLDVAAFLYKEGLPFTLTIIGYGYLFGQLQKYAYEHLQLPLDKVMFVHGPPKEEIMHAYKAADLFLFSSQSDTQGLVLAEAMACGTPVIALDGPGQRDIIEDGYNGRIVYSQQEMAKIITQMSHNRNEIATLAQGALNTAKRYIPSMVAERHMDFYRTIISKKQV